jgi:hypothetical protein
MYVCVCMYVHTHIHANAHANECLLARRTSCTRQQACAQGLHATSVPRHPEITCGTHRRIHQVACGQKNHVHADRLLREDNHQRVAGILDCAHAHVHIIDCCFQQLAEQLNKLRFGLAKDLMPCQG